MAGYFTQKRTLNKSLRYAYAFKRNDGIQGSSTNGFPVETQTTFSWRDRRPANAIGSELDDNIFTYRENAKNRPGDTGHLFWTEKRTYSGFRKSMVYLPPNPSESGAWWRGPVVCTAPSGWLDIPAIDTNYYGTLAISKTIPTAPQANLSQFAGELREQIPTAPGRLFVNRGITPQTIGSEWLNITFGIIPTVSDSLKLLTAVSQSEKIIQQLRRDSGRMVRRRFSFPEKKSFVVGSSGVSNTSFPNHQPSFWADVSGTYVQHKTLSEKYFFSAAYTYHLPDGDSVVDKFARFAAEAQKVIGSGITPETFYELTRYSWLIDWIANIGTVVSNFSRFRENGLVMRYGYLQRFSRYENTYIIDGFRLKNGSVTFPLSETYLTERKERVRATPYGFGQNPNAWSALQWANLAALGLTKTPTSLNVN